MVIRYITDNPETFSDYSGKDNQSESSTWRGYIFYWLQISGKDTLINTLASRYSSEPLSKVFSKLSFLSNIKFQSQLCMFSFLFLSLYKTLYSQFSVYSDIE